MKKGKLENIDPFISDIKVVLNSQPPIVPNGYSSPEIDSPPSKVTKNYFKKEDLRMYAAIILIVGMCCMVVYQLVKEL